MTAQAVHPFPARMAPEIAMVEMSSSTGCLTVLDPMMGSGTVIALARARGHAAIGVDIDPLSVLISRVRISAFDTSEVRRYALAVLVRAQRIFVALPQREAYPQGADAETRRFVAFWFDGHARRQLASLAIAIARVRNKVANDILWCAFSRLIITKQAGASLAMDLSHSRPHKVFASAPVKPFKKFIAAVEHVMVSARQEAVEAGPAPRVLLGDARNLPLRDNSVDLVVTSPPYLNAIDYMRCSKFSLVWMGYTTVELRQIRAEGIGTEVRSPTLTKDAPAYQVLRSMNLQPPLGRRPSALLARYIDDMHRATAETSRVLRPGGRAIYVVGENTVRGTFIRNSLLISKLARLAGLKLQRRRVRILPANRRYLPPPSRRNAGRGINTRIRREVVLYFQKAA